MSGALDAVSPRAFRDACGAFATGVAVVSTLARGRAHAMTVNSFASVSLGLPLVVWSLCRASRLCGVFREAGHFAVSVLAGDQQPIAARFAGRGDPFGPDLALIAPEGRGPLIPGALAHLDCDTHAVLEGGDHLMLVGQVRRLGLGSGAPLVFFSGRFETLAG